MRLILAAALAIAAIVSAFATVAAERRPRYGPVGRAYGYQQPGASGYGNPYGSGDREREGRPQGNYPGYPDWAQRAFAPKGH